ncbi:hypothetical protein [Planomonospora venezuelensis]|uniref:Serine/threonine protein kinase n=1 Tax=Planomonospora venezuelensis TaxID=1999 RepID=A0A841D067_PLAVE|nr:hypothetical protein [Planomonospora venezuelensis]MBB5962909.1 hypothetical protein [Planomonospora venezuelensis]GIN04527.1 hypothetical protein Pve01_61850 [Planomonospora venezuelensis]
MKRLGPVLTLAVGAVMTVALGALSATTSPTTQDAAQGGPAPVAEATSEASASPAPSKTAKPVPAKADYAGRVRGNGGLIAISIRNGKAVGYFCDGRIEAWLKGKAADGRVTLSGPGGASVEAKLGGGRAAGTLEFGAEQWDFAAPTVKKPSGLYRASAIVRGAQVRAGWIYLDDGSRVGLALVDGEPAEVAIPEPGENATVNGEEVDPKDVDEFIGEIS